MAEQQIQIQDAQSQAAIDDMRLDQAQAHQRLSEKEYEAARLTVEQIEAEVGQLIQDYRRADTQSGQRLFQPSGLSADSRPECNTGRPEVAFGADGGLSVCTAAVEDIKILVSFRRNAIPNAKHFINWHGTWSAQVKQAA